jgi:hypothetical protein
MRHREFVFKNGTYDTRIILQGASCTIAAMYVNLAPPPVAGGGAVGYVNIK